MRVLMIAPHYAPDLGPSAPLFTMLCEGLVKRGHQVIVLTTVPHYPSGQVSSTYRGKWIQRSMENKVQVIRVWLPSVNRANFAMTGGTICAAERITIKNNVAVGANTTIIDTDFHPLDPQVRRLRPQDARTAPILIEDDVFIGMNSLILKGVTIGKGSVVGAGSIVTKDVPPGVIVAGNPARIVRELA
jgi:hypothetical protein